MNKEFDALRANKIWVVVPPNPDQNVIGCKWVYKIKRRADGSLERYKARLVTKGFHQEEGIDFFEIYSPVVRPTTIRVILTLALSYGWPLRQLNVSNAFSHGDLQETVHMQQLPGLWISLNRITYACCLKLFTA